MPATSVTSEAGRVMTQPAVRALAGAALPRVAAQKLEHFGPAMLFHCAQEMNHLATFLPNLYSEYRDTP